MRRSWSNAIPSAKCVNFFKYCSFIFGFPLNRTQGVFNACGISMDIVTRIASGLLEDELFEAIEINNRERFGNVVFMAGGAGSGKSTTCDKIFDF